MTFPRTLTLGALIAMCVAGAGCGTLAPGAEAIIVTRDATTIKNCKPVGTVGGDATALTQVAGDWNGAGWYQIRNQALTLGADHVLLTNSIWVHPDTGVAYRCHS